MRLITALSACALIAFAVPAVAQVSGADSGPGTNSSQPNGNPGATGGTDPKNGGMTEGRSSAVDGGATRSPMHGSAAAPVGGPTNSGN